MFIETGAGAGAGGGGGGGGGAGGFNLNRMIPEPVEVGGREEGKEGSDGRLGGG